MSDAAQLEHLVSTSDVAKAFFEHLAARIKNYRITTVERAMRITGSGRRDVVDLFKAMQELDLGTFIVGRRSGVSRFEWSVLMVDTAKAALGELELDDIEKLADADLDELENEEDLETEGEDGGLVQHSFALRPRTAPVIFALPEDLTEHEAQRLSRFMLSLPIEQ